MKRRRRASAACAISAVALAAAVMGSGPSGAAEPLGHGAGAESAGEGADAAVRAPRWDALFDRTSGWTGADGIYSVPLTGDERPGSAGAGTKTFFTFSDTFVGEVDEWGRRLPGSTLVNNTTALLRGGVPNPAKIQFFVNKDANGKPIAQVVPDTSPDHWFWPGDGIVIDNSGYLFSLRMRKGTGGPFNFAVDGVSLLTSDTATLPPLGTYDQVDTPLYLPAAGGVGEIHYGQALMPNTAAAGAPAPDGFLYVYGIRNDLSKKLMVARVEPALIADFSAYEFWDGSGWTGSITAAVPVTSRISSEFSVTPLGDGRYVLVFQLDGLSSDVAVRYGASPVGPWTAPSVIWTAPEDERTPNTYVYNAKAHPHLSTPGSLLISYNVNTFSFGEHFADADIYRPRFIKLPLR